MKRHQIKTGCFWDSLVTALSLTRVNYTVHKLQYICILVVKQRSPNAMVPVSSFCNKRKSVVVLYEPQCSPWNRMSGSNVFPQANVLYSVACAGAESSEAASCGERRRGGKRQQTDASAAHQHSRGSAAPAPRRHGSSC